MLTRNQAAGALAVVIVLTVLNKVTSSGMDFRGGLGSENAVSENSGSGVADSVQKLFSSKSKEDELIAKGDIAATLQALAPHWEPLRAESDAEMNHKLDNHAYELQVEDLSKYIAFLENPEKSQTHRLLALEVLGRSRFAVPALTTFLKGAFTDEGKQSFEGSLRVNALRKLEDQYNPAKVDLLTASMLEIIEKQKDPTLNFLSKIVLSGLQEKPGKLARFMDKLQE